MARLIREFSRHRQNIVYVPRADYAEKYAVHLATDLGSTEVSGPTADLIKLIEEEVHKDYYLIDALRGSVAFHHSKVPDMVRAEIERQYQQGLIHHLVCTSTLLEGVNLPAEAMFIPFPRKDRLELSPFEFGNLIGRAGRISKQFYGTVYCIEDAEDRWSDKYLNVDYSKDVTPASTRVLKSSFVELLDFMSTAAPKYNSRLSSASSFLKHKFLLNPAGFEAYLATKNLDTAQRDTLLGLLGTALNGITIPISIIEQNPTIDPLKADQLYKQVVADGIESWTIHEHANLLRRQKREKAEEVDQTQRSLYWQLRAILERLNEIFDIEKEAYMAHRVSRSIGQMAIYATRWLQSSPQSQLIKEELRFYSVHLNPAKRILMTDKAAINRQINETITLYSSMVNFLLLKYLKLLSDILAVVVPQDKVSVVKLSLSLPTMLELGTMSAVALRLISGGVPRSIAVRIFRLVPEQFREAPFEWLKRQTSIPDLPAVYVTFLREKGLLSLESE